MPRPGPSAKSLALRALRALGKATPAQVHEWARAEVGEGAPAEQRFRQVLPELLREGAVGRVPDEFGVYTLPEAAEGRAAEGRAAEPPAAYRTAAEYLAERRAARAAEPERAGDVCLVRVSGPDGAPIFSYWLSGRTVQEGPPIEVHVEAPQALAAASAGATTGAVSTSKR